ncbi:MAG: DUF503 domain-containing protein [Planctomycetota bacterium]
MYLGVLQFSMAIPHALSLKDKRSVVRALKDRLRNKFNLAIAEVADLDEWTYATFGAATVGNDIPRINSVLDKVVDMLETWPDATLDDHQIEIIRGDGD